MITFTKSARSKNGDDDPSRATSAAAFGTAGVVLKSSKGRLYRLDAVNISGATPYYLMVFDKATAPINGDTPIWRRRLPTGGEASLMLEDYGLACANGIAIAISSADATLTLAASNDAHYAAHYK